MAHKHLIAFGASLLVAGIANAQDLDASQVITLEKTSTLSVADYEADQTGSVINAEPEASDATFGTLMVVMDSDEIQMAYSNYVDDSEFLITDLRQDAGTDISIE